MMEKSLSYAYPQKFEKGGAVPDWVDPDYSYTPGRKPNMREMMEYLTGRTVEDLYADPNSNWQEYSRLASDILYGVVGSNKDTRDFNQIMAAGGRGDIDSIRKAAALATRQMYSNQNRSAEELEAIRKDYASQNISVNPISNNLAQIIKFDPANNTYISRLYLTDNQGVLLREAGPNSGFDLFGLTQEEADAARQRMVPTQNLASYYNPYTPTSFDQIATLPQGNVFSSGSQAPTQFPFNPASFDMGTTVPTTGSSGTTSTGIASLINTQAPSYSATPFNPSQYSAPAPVYGTSALSSPSDLTPFYRAPEMQAPVSGVFGAPITAEQVRSQDILNPFVRR